jgi:hypothetical protein
LADTVPGVQASAKVSNGKVSFRQIMRKLGCPFLRCNADDPFFGCYTRHTRHWHGYQVVLISSDIWRASGYVSAGTICKITQQYEMITLTNPDSHMSIGQRHNLKLNTVQPQMIPIPLSFNSRIVSMVYTEIYIEIRTNQYLLYLGYHNISNFLE